MKIGVVVWAEGLNVKFRINQGAKVERGQLVKVYDGNIKYILRVYNFRPESLLTPVEIARISEKKSHGEDFILYDKGLRLYDTAIAIIVAQVDEDGVARGPSSVPSLFTDVETLDKIDLEQLNLDTGDIMLGYVRVGHRKSKSIVSLNGGEIIPHHILVSGVTGAGKSNLSKIIAYSIMRNEENNYSFIIFDCESEYFSGNAPDKYGLAHLPEAEKKLFYVTSDVGEPSILNYSFYYKGIRINRRIRSHPLEVSFSSLYPGDFTMTGEFSSPQEELLWLARKEFGEDWLSILLKSSPSFLYRRFNRMVHKNTINTIKRKLRYFLGNNDIFKEYVETDLLKAILGAIGKGMVILIDMPYASEGEEKLLTCTIARRIFYTYEKLRKVALNEWVRLPYVLITVEEAHRYLSKSSLTNNGEIRENIFSIISKRGRKYRVGALYITQMPGELIEPVVRQTLTKIILPLPTKPDYMKVIQYSPYLDEAEQEIKTLDRGEALVVSPPSGLRFAVPVKIFCFEELVKDLLEEERLLLKSKRFEKKGAGKSRIAILDEFKK